MDKNRLMRIILGGSIILGSLLFAVSRVVASVGFLLLVSALACFFAGFCASLFLPYRSSRAKKAVKLLKIFALAAFVFGLASFIIVQGLIVSGWPDGEPQSVDCLIILGAGLRGEQMSYVLYSRMSVAAKYLNDNPGCIAVVSGGQGPGESIAEALAMKRYLESQGVDAGRIIMEDKSGNTEQNLRFSFEILREKSLDDGKIAVLSNSFHLFRAKRLAASEGYAVETVGAPMPKVGLVPLNSYVREYFSVMLMFAKELQ